MCVCVHACVCLSVCMCVCLCDPVCLLLCSVGMVFAFLTNQAIKDTIDNIVPTFNNAVDNVESFANASVSVS